MPRMSYPTIESKANLLYVQQKFIFTAYPTILGRTATKVRFFYQI